MATVTIEIPDESLERCVKAICKAEGLAVTNANAKKALAGRVRALVKEQERLEAVTSAESTVTEVSGIK